jgi:Amt family ammonium transporter
MLRPVLPVLLVLVFFFFGLSSNLLGEEAEPLEKADAAAAETVEINSGDNAWMLMSSALVLFMTAPGLALFYGGLVRRKNVLSVIMQCIFLMGIMTMLWGIIGYSLCFGGSNPYIGNLDHLMMKGVQMEDGVAPIRAGTAIPELTFMVFQGMFFIITPALICGAFAERMKFSSMVVFCVLWGLLVYCPLCHWVWGGGILAYGEDHSIAGGAIDFAGGTVVHISSGISALICALMLGSRIGYGSEKMAPHNLTYTAIGTAMLWFGWFGFNAGSELAADGVAANAFVVTHFCAAAGAVAWATVEWIVSGKPTLLGACTGAVAGLVCITPAAGFVQPSSAFIMGIVAGIVCYLACTTLKAALKYDDSLDAFGVHGVGGTVGAVLTGVFATAQVYGDGGLIEGNVPLFVGNIVAVLVTLVFSVAVTFVLLTIIRLTMGLRVDEKQERTGLDVSLHGEEGYILNN